MRRFMLWGVWETWFLYRRFRHHLLHRLPLSKSDASLALNDAQKAMDICSHSIRTEARSEDGLSSNGQTVPSKQFDFSLPPP